MEHDKLVALIDKAVFDYHLIEDGDRILVGASGGKDSTLLVEYFADRIKRLSGSPAASREPHFTFTAFHVQSDFSEPLSPALLETFCSWNVHPVVQKVDVLARLKNGRLMNCYWCSTQRRKELLDYAIKNHYNKIALGHHLDDILETLLMNAVEQGELSTMPISLTYDHYPVTIIRPLCYLGVDMIISHAQKEGWQSATCTCSYQNNSGRKEARTKLAVLTDNDYAKKMRLFSSLKNIQTHYLP